MRTSNQLLSAIWDIIGPDFLIIRKWPTNGPMSSYKQKMTNKQIPNAVSVYYLYIKKTALFCFFKFDLSCYKRGKQWSCKGFPGENSAHTRHDKLRDSTVYSFQVQYFDVGAGLARGPQQSITRIIISNIFFF